MAFVAESIQPKSGVPSTSTNSGTTTTTASDCATAFAVSVVALSRPASTACLSLTSRSCSPGNGSVPALTSSTTFSLTSAPMTRCPLDANCTASGSPILPRATTQMFMDGRYFLFARLVGEPLAFGPADRDFSRRARADFARETRAASAGAGDPW